MARGGDAIGGVRVEGLRQLVRELETLGVEVGDLKDAFAAIARKGADLAASFAPQRTGRLRASIRGNRAKNKAVVRAGSARLVPYAGVINYGWRRHRIKPANFMQRADEAMRPTAAAELESAINRLISEKGLT